MPSSSCSHAKRNRVMEMACSEHGIFNNTGMDRDVYCIPGW